MIKKMFIITCLITSFVILNGAIGWSGNIWPNSGSNHVNGNDISVYYQIWKSGVTDSSGQGADISATLYYRLQGETIYNSVAMSYNGDVGSNDEYTAVLPNTAFDSNDVVEWYCEGLDETDTTYSYGTDQSGAGAFTDTNPGTYNITAGTNQDVTVTFQVDMSMQANVTSVYLAGSFNGWDSSATQMSLVRNGIYSVDVFFSAGSNQEQEYKYVKNGTDWEYIANRGLIINDAASTQILDVVYFNNESLNAVSPAIGDGSSSSPYQIATLENLTWIAADDSRWSFHYIQTANIDASSTSSWFSGAGWLPIGNSTTNFTGEYNGAEYTISNLAINRPNTPNVGLFGYVGRDADGVVIKDLGLTNVAIQGARGTGSLVGRVVGDQNNLIIRCYADNGTVVGDGATGGLVGANNSYIENPSNSNDHPIIQESYADIAVSWSRKTDSGADKIGGLAGCNQKGKIYFSYARGSVTVDNDPAVTVINSDGTIPSRIGGLVGCIMIRGYVEDSYSTGLVTTSGSVSNVGAFLGRGGTGGSGGDVYSSFFDNLGGTNPSTNATPYIPSGVTSETTANMQISSTFTNAGWDFTNIWGITGADYPTLNANPQEMVEITFGGGSSFTPSISPGNTNQAIGLFTLSGSAAGSILERVTVRLDGTRTGISNFKLWEDTDDTFDPSTKADTQLGSTIATDPGDGSSITFTGFTSSITTTTKYYFISADVASNATGSIRAYIADNSGLTFLNGQLSSTTQINDAPLSQGETPLPVILSHFAATFQNGISILVWTTQSETNNSHWNVYRSNSENIGQSIKVNNEIIAGAGTTSEQSNYEFKDVAAIESNTNYWYWLESVDLSGNSEFFGPTELVINEPDNPEPPATPVQYGLKQNYPNPFNPSTEIRFNLAESQNVELTIFDVKGKKVKTLHKGFVDADSEHSFIWNGTNENGKNVSSGIYFYKLVTSEKTETKKMLLVK